MAHSVVAAETATHLPMLPESWTTEYLGPFSGIAMLLKGRSQSPVEVGYASNSLYSLTGLSLQLPFPLQQ